MREFGEYYLKFRLNADASADDATVDLRMITFVTFTLTDIPAQFYGSDIQVTAGHVERNGDPYSTGGRTIVLSDLLG